MRKVIGIGETVMDILFRHQQPEAAVPGGSCFNSIISLGRAHVPSIFVGYTGGDVVGQQTVDFLRDNGVSTDYFEMRPGERSSISLAFLNEQCDANYIFYKEKPNVSEDAPIPAFGKDDVMLYGSYYAICQDTHSQVRRMLQAAKEAEAIVYYDLNIRRSHQHELDTLTPTLLDNLHLSTIVRGSADDFEVMYNLRDAAQIYEQYIRQHCPIFIYTSGPGLISVYTPTCHIDFEVAPVETVSTVGAGDSFNAGFLYALLRDGITRDQLATLSESAWQRLLTTGCSFAAQVCQSRDNYISLDFAQTLQ